MMYVRCSRCGKRRPSGTKCDCIKRARKEYDSKYRNKESTQFYHSSDWLTVRNRVMNIYDSIDVFLFVTEHKIVIADVVHHIEELKENRSKALDVDNLIPLSSSTHNHIHTLYNRDEKTKKEMQERLRRMLHEFKDMFDDVSL